MLVAGAFGGDDLDDGGDDFSGLLNDDGVTNADVLTVDLILVVQGGAGDGGAGDKHGLELGNGGEYASAAHLDGDVTQSASLFARGETCRRRPTWGAWRWRRALGAVESCLTLMTAPSVA